MKLKIRSALVRQFSRPAGLLGRVVGLIMATRPSNLERNMRTLAQVDIQPDDRILEIGFGPGIGIERAAELAKRGEVIGVDHSELMLRQASRRNATAIAAGRVDLRLASRRSRHGPASQQASDTALAGGIVRPPFLYLACLVLGFALDRLLPLPLTFPEVTLVRRTAGGGLIAVGLAIMAAGIRNFSHAATPVPSNRPVRALVTTGIHGWSRNPIYVGMFLLYAGIGLAARSPWVLILALPIVIVMRCGVVAREEAYLERRFGDAYGDYKACVRRWL